MHTISVKEVKGIGQKTAENLETLNIHTVYDLLYYFPSRYNVHEVKKLRELVHDDTVTISGTIVHEPSLNFYGRKRSRLAFTIEVENVAIRAVMFNRAFAKKHLHPGDHVMLTGKWDAHRLQITVNQYKKGPLEQQATIQSIYSLKGDLKSSHLRRQIHRTLTQYANQMPEILPNNYMTSYKLPTIQNALWTMHYPKTRIALKHARRRFIYEEFLLFQLKMLLLRKMKREATVGNAQHYEPVTIQEFIHSLPYTLTNAQLKSVNQILSDMKSPYQMNRLLQGDVGSGKTAVAAICLYATITAGKQGALMVPTEILAEQHVESLRDMFGERAKVALLTGSITAKKRVVLMKAIEEQEIDIIVGTHALIQDDVLFHDLGFVIVDEQHRFGVEQRRSLSDKGLMPDVLFMTATPIPRTLAITTFGDMDVSIIDEMPKGRKEVETYWTNEQTFERVLSFVQQHVEKGEQAYVISPLIEESDKMDIQNAEDLYQDLKSFFPETIHVGLMHGRLPTEEKEALMQQFANNEVHVLVSTTVVEVGVNVPNATIMIIYDAERFGLSQLHQLRGRVGRGEQQSYCILIAEPKGEIGRERMKIMTETSDGFKLAEQDLQLRGPGDFFGKKQSGLPEFNVADPIHNYRALETARKDADEIIEMDLLNNDPEYLPLKIILESDETLTDLLS